LFAERRLSLKNHVKWGKNRGKTVFKCYPLAGNIMHLGSQGKVESGRIVFVFLTRRFSFFKKHFSMILKKLMPIRTDPTSVNQPEEKLDLRDCSLFASFYKNKIHEPTNGTKE
jgi:hypothetical protein